MSRRLAAAVATATLSLGLVVAYGLLSTRDRADRAPDGAAPAQAEALQRDLNLTAGQASARMAADKQAGRTMPALRTKLGAAYGGAWMTADSPQPVVGITDEAMAPAVRAAGAQPKVVTYSATQLDDLKAKLDGNATKAPADVTGWHVDPATNSVVVVAGADTAAVRAFVAGSGVTAGAVRVMVSGEKPRTMAAADLRGGDRYFINGQGFCSIGFAVVGGYVTAGHCGKAGDKATTPKGAALGTFVASSFPGTNDYAWVRVTADWKPRGLVNNYRGGTVRVTGSQEAIVGAMVCRSGSTTGWHCGRVLAKNATVRYPEGMVTGLVRTNVCAEPGDSGGSWLTGDQAQGVTSGGSGDCKVGGMTYFQPVNEILARYGLKLVTS
jgi:streptogrisin C